MGGFIRDWEGCRLCNLERSSLSTKALCEQTWIEGIQYFSLETEKQLKKRDRELRKNLIHKILSKKDKIKDEKWKHHEEETPDHYQCLEIE